MALSALPIWPPPASAFQKPRPRQRAAPAEPSDSIAALKNKDASVREDAANQMGAARDKAAAKPLIAALSDPSPRVREAAAFALGQVSDPAAVDPLVKAMSDADPGVRASSAFALGMLSDEAGLDAIADGLEDQDSSVRSACAAALGLMRADDELDELVDLLGDGAFDVRYDAAWALGQIGSGDAAEPLKLALARAEDSALDSDLKEAFRETVQSSLESIEARSPIAKSGSRPRRAAEPKPDPGSFRQITIRQSVIPARTEAALRANLAAIVGVRVLVGTDGRGVRAYVTRRARLGLDRRAIEAALEYRFYPALQNGLVQTDWTNFAVTFGAK